MVPVAIGWPSRSHSNVNAGLLAQVPGLQVTVWPTCIGAGDLRRAGDGRGDAGGRVSRAPNAGPAG